MFIYKIKNLSNNKIYIGQSINPIEERFKRHINDALNNVLDTHLARAIRKYGSENFIIELVDSAENQKDLNDKEQYYIRLYDSIKNGYNETDALYKCGGNTYMSKNADELQLIRNKLSLSKQGTKNPNHRSVKVRNEKTKEEYFFETIVDCQRFFNEKNHRFITTRVTQKTKTLFKNIWNIAYVEDEYRPLSNELRQNRAQITVINLMDGTKHYFSSIRQMCDHLKINRGKVRTGINSVFGNYQITFQKSVSTNSDECKNVGDEIGTFPKRKATET